MFQAGNIMYNMGRENVFSLQAAFPFEVSHREREAALEKLS